ncbi:twin-arginine translocase TatA/TatE family subunit [Streptomyces sp. NPDC046887]|uniref:twin-arginine translocase TatA/TatE family subunit n=1 Tax=Streptomyces sp. NPDC046887 TaxID=3155472 RepID=UPI0033FE8834
MFGLSELAILLIVVLLVFGAKKLPELARNAGKAARILKSEARAMKAENAEPEPEPVAEPRAGAATGPGTASGPAQDTAAGGPESARPGGQGGGPVLQGRIVDPGERIGSADPDGARRQP